MRNKKRRPEQLSWLEDLSGREVRVTAVGAGRALIENHTGILEYSPARVLVRCPKGTVAVNGRELMLREVRKNALIVAGAIDSVEFPHDSP
ncbi:MAG: hypothetical protein GX592_08340 [Clostridiales bacterium]|nr:hypothetical protein [Clostridiales bacterium]